MKKKDFQEFYGFTDEDMSILELLLKLFKGKIISIDKQKESLYTLSKGVR